MTMGGKRVALAGAANTIEVTAKNIIGYTSQAASETKSWASDVLARVESIEAQCRCIRDVLKTATEEQP